MTIQPAPFAPDQKIVLVIGNSTFPDPRNLEPYRAQIDFVVCTDGGTRNALRYGFTPDVIIGDFDSISTADQKHFADTQTVMKRMPDQEQNDLEKAVLYLLQYNRNAFILAGFWGQREDQTLATISVMQKYGGQARFLLLTPGSRIFLLPAGQFQLPAFDGQTISLFGAPSATGITTDGLRYPLNGESLTDGSRGLSNTATHEKILIRLSTGQILIVAMNPT